MLVVPWFGTVPGGRNGQEPEMVGCGLSLFSALGPPYGAPHSPLKELKHTMGRIRRLVLDTLKPHDPSIIELADKLTDLDGVSAVNISIYEMDRKVENAKITIEGEAVDFTIIARLIEEMGGAIHSVDEVAAGRHIIDDAETLQG